MLSTFILTNHDLIVDRTRARTAPRSPSVPGDDSRAGGIRLFLEQLVAALRSATWHGDRTVEQDEIRQGARLHGEQMFHMGLPVAEVVRDYGSVCQAVTELAVEQNAAISTEDFQRLNLCLDHAIADAVTEFARQREQAIEDRGTEKLGVLAHELRNLLNTAMLSFEIMKSGQVAIGGSTGAVHARSLLGLRNLVDRSLADVRLDAGISSFEPIGVSELVHDLQIGASLQADAKGVALHVGAVDRTLTIEGDRQSLAAALSNLLHNAFKFTRKGGHIALSVRTTTDRVLFEIEDECGGLPPGEATRLFLPFEQHGTDRSGVGLGLAICLKAARANGGEIHVRDLPGKGCVFTLDLPRRPPPPLTLIEGGKDVERSSPPTNEASAGLSVGKTGA